MVKTSLEHKMKDQVAKTQQEVENQLKPISAKLNEIDNRNEPVVAFRATSVKDAASHTTYVDFNPGDYKSKIVCLIP